MEQLEICSQCGRVFFCAECAKEAADEHTALCQQLVHYYEEMKVEEKKMECCINEFQGVENYFVTKRGHFMEYEETQRFIWTHSLYLNALRALSRMHHSQTILNEICDRSLLIEQLCGLRFQSQVNTARSLFDCGRTAECYNFIKYCHEYYFNPVQVECSLRDSYQMNGNLYDNLFCVQNPDTKFPVELLELLLILKLQACSTIQQQRQKFKQNRIPIVYELPEDVCILVEEIYCGSLFEKQQQDAVRYMQLIKNRTGVKQLKDLLKNGSVQVISGATDEIKLFVDKYG